MKVQEIMKTEFGIEMEKVIRQWDAALEIPDRDENQMVVRALAWCQAQWEVYKLALKQFCGKEYFFTRTDEYFGICTEDETEFLMKQYRERTEHSRYYATKDDVRRAMKETRRQAEALGL